MYRWFQDQYRSWHRHLWAMTQIFTIIRLRYKRPPNANSSNWRMSRHDSLKKLPGVRHISDTQAVIKAPNSFIIDWKLIWECWTQWDRQEEWDLSLALNPFVVHVKTPIRRSFFKERKLKGKRFGKSSKNHSGLSNMKDLKIFGSQ